MLNTRLQILFSLFIALLIWVNLLWVKLVSFFWIPVSVGIFMVPFIFLITDIVQEVYGKCVVKRFLMWGVIASIFVLLFTALFVYLEPHEKFSFNEEYETIFWNSLRMLIASLVAFILSQTHDIIAYDWWKKQTKGKSLWVRNNFSTIPSQFIDTFVFMMIAFYHTTPDYTFVFIITLAIPYYLFKISFAILDTPLVYLWVNWLSKDKNNN